MLRRVFGRQCYLLPRYRGTPGGAAMTVRRPPPPLPPDASDGARRAHERQQEEFLTEGFTPLEPRSEDDSTTATLRALSRDHKRFLSMHQPIRSSLWLALLRTAEELDARAEATETPAIIRIGEAVARKAMAGDMQAVAFVAERIEGKAGLRTGDSDPEAETRRADMVAAIEGVVRVLTNNKRGETIEGEVTDANDSNDSGE